MSDCNHDCANCGEKCSKSIEKEVLNKASKIKHVIGIVSGKGGVGKSTVTALMASKLSELGYRVGIMDADITGPSIPKMFGVSGQLYGTELGIDPAIGGNGIKMVSMNLLLDAEEDPVILRGPVLAGVIKQFWTDVNWGELDYLLIDMPPGTGDVPLTVYQSLPVDGIVIVTSPQELVKMIVMKAYNMASTMNIPVLGLVENYSYYKCPDCGREEKIFGESGIDELAAGINIPVIAKLPIMPAVARSADEGKTGNVSREIEMNLRAITELN